MTKNYDLEQELLTESTQSIPPEEEDNFNTIITPKDKTEGLIGGVVLA